MKELVLMRHGEALSARESGATDDAGRKLSEIGKAQISLSAAKLKELGFLPEIIVSSPLVRAVETADIAASFFPSAKRKKEPVLASQAPLSEILKTLICAAGDASCVLAIGHQPTMGALSGILINEPPLPFHTGGFAYLKLPAGPGRTAATLAEFFSPEQI